MRFLSDEIPPARSRGGVKPGGGGGGGAGGSRCRDEEGSLKGNMRVFDGILVKGVKKVHKRDSRAISYYF